MLARPGLLSAAMTPGHDPVRTDERAQRLVGTVNGTVVGAGVLAVSAGDEADALKAGAYVLATVAVLWLADGWAHALGLRAAGAPEQGLLAGLRRQRSVIASVVAPLAALALARIVGATDESAIDVALWVCVGELAFFGAAVARREGAPPHRVVMTALGCAALGLTIVVLKALVH